MKKTTLGLSLLVGGLLTASWATADEPAGAGTGEKSAPETGQATAAEAHRQTKCPVMGGDIDKSQYVDHNGKRIYICCKGCEAPLKKDPEKFIRKLEAEGVVPDTVPEKDAKPDDHTGKKQ